ncbi:MipA/OmpV family protein [Bosea robiniae]|jgi:outer membrane protein|uniref:Outer membrane scaffolding protein for murein synthesis, MipA/OmpV family n=1 Tax=Bosea robiniae TaxID=1036780 RepID=A0ABY0NC75_9HYPH|nr:MipA/OmpV family protein [Bosea robiniae]SDF25411.1 Outer membrane scaffolding protein for murein synthesis, MipA/OmpV family [Bosea robiniae]
MRCVAYLAGLSTCLALSLPGYAQAQSSDYSTLTSPQSAQNWYITVGAGVRYQPDYTGSDDYVFRARPIISLGKGLKSTWWSAEDDTMLSIGVFSGQGWRIGFSGDLLWKRSAKVNPALVAVPATKFGAELGGFAEFYPTSWLRGRVDLRRGVVAHDGVVADFKLDAFSTVGQWTLGIGPRMRITSADYVRTYFGTRGAQPGTGGLLQRYNAGVHTVGALAQVTYHWSDQLKTTAYVEYKRLVGDATRSPIVRPFGSRDSLTFGLSASYSFDTGTSYSFGL